MFNKEHEDEYWLVGQLLEANDNRNQTILYTEPIPLIVSQIDCIEDDAGKDTMGKSADHFV